MAEALKKYDAEAAREKKIPKRAATSIVALANFPDEEVDYEEDSKKFSEESGFYQFKVKLKSNILFLIFYVKEYF